MDNKEKINKELCSLESSLDNIMKTLSKDTKTKELFNGNSRGITVEKALEICISATKEIYILNKGL